MSLDGSLLLVRHQLDDDGLAVGKNLVVLRAVQIDDHAGDGRILAEAGNAKALYLALIEQFGAQVAGRLSVGEIEDQAVGVGDHLATHGYRLAGGNLYINAARGAGHGDALKRGQRFRGRRHGPGARRRPLPACKPTMDDRDYALLLPALILTVVKRHGSDLGPSE